MDYDGGQTWQKNSGQAFASSMVIEPENPNTLFAAYERKAYKSLDGGNNWTECSLGLAGTCQDLILISRQPLAASTHGIFLSLDGVEAWSPSNSGLRAAQVETLSVAKTAPNVVFAGIKDSGIYNSVNFGKTWELLSFATPCESIKKILINPQNPEEVFFVVPAGG